MGIFGAVSFAVIHWFIFGVYGKENSKNFGWHANRLSDKKQTGQTKRITDKPFYTGELDYYILSIYCFRISYIMVMCVCVAFNPLFTLQ